MAWTLLASLPLHSIVQQGSLTGIYDMFVIATALYCIHIVRNAPDQAERIPEQRPGEEQMEGEQMEGEQMDEQLEYETEPWEEAMADRPVVEAEESDEPEHHEVVEEEEEEEPAEHDGKGDGKGDEEEEPREHELKGKGDSSWQQARNKSGGGKSKKGKGKGGYKGKTKHKGKGYQHGRKGGHDGASSSDLDKSVRFLCDRLCIALILIRFNSSSNHRHY